MTGQRVDPTIEGNGWTLVSAEERHAAHPGTFEIPSRARRESIAPGQAAKLLFDIQTMESGHVIDRGVDRMWVIVRSRTDDGYVSVLDSDPGLAENLDLRKGDAVFFKPEHVAAIDTPPKRFVEELFGKDFFKE